MGADDRPKGEEMAGQVRMEELLAKAVSIDGRKEWHCRVSSEMNVWTRSQCQRCQTNILTVLQGNKQADCINQEWSELVGIIFTR